jgi:hypothetical protein
MELSEASLEEIATELERRPVNLLLLVQENVEPAAFALRLRPLYEDWLPGGLIEIARAMPAIDRLRLAAALLSDYVEAAMSASTSAKPEEARPRAWT